MSKNIKGKLIQDGIPTPEKPVEIKVLNLFEVNGIQYTDNIPDNMNIGITKKQYCEYLQLQQENKQLKEVINKAKLKSIYLQERYGYILDDLTFLLSNVEDNNER